MNDALVVSQRKNDNFYVTAFKIEMWLDDVTYRTFAQYAVRKSVKNTLDAAWGALDKASS